MIATSGSVNLVNLSSTSSTTGSSSNLILGERSGLLLNPYQHLGGGGGSAGSGPCGGFSTQYAWMCDLHGLPYREEVAWVRPFPYFLHASSLQNTFRDTFYTHIKHISPNLGINCVCVCKKRAT